MDFIYAFVNVSFQFVSNVVSSSESVCSGGYGKFACDDSCDFSPLPPFCVMQQGVLED